MENKPYILKSEGNIHYISAPMIELNNRYYQVETYKGDLKEFLSRNVDKQIYISDSQLVYNDALMNGSVRVKPIDEFRLFAI